MWRWAVVGLFIWMICSCDLDPLYTEQDPIDLGPSQHASACGDCR